MPEQKKEALTLTTDQLQELLVNMAREIRRPADPTPEEEAQALADREMRASSARLALERQENKRLERLACTHNRRDGTSTCVFVYQGNYLICQQCQGIIHPEPRPTGPIAKETEEHIYDTRLFNQHYSRRVTDF